MEITTAEMRLAKIIWNNNGIESKELVAICERDFGMKISTTYTLLRRMCDKGYFKLADKYINVLVTEEEYSIQMSKNLIDEHYNGVVPAFFASFIKNQKFTKKQIEEIEKIISEYK